MTRAVVPLVVLLLLALVVFVAVSLARGSGESGLSADRRLLVGRVKDLAWDHREIDPDLATALIEHINQVPTRRIEPDVVLDELLEIAWRLRETSPDLSVIVIDEIRRGRKAIEG